MLMRMIPIAALLAATSAAPTGEFFNTIADTVFQNGSIYTLDEYSSKFNALAVKDGVIVFIGSNDDAKSHVGNTTKVVNLRGQAAIPGLIDSHIHILGGGIFLLKCDLNYQPLDLPSVLEHIQRCIDDETGKSDNDWMEAVNLDYPTLTSRSGPIDRTSLDMLKTTRPVIIRSSDYHTVLVNSRALEISNITANTLDPSGGVVERLPGGKEPSGVLQDNAPNLLGLPQPTPEEAVQAGLAAMQLLRQSGITTFQEASAQAEYNAVFQAIQQGGGLSARAYFDYRIEAPSSMNDVPGLVAKSVELIRTLDNNSTIQPTPSIKWQAIKAFLDGVITYPSRTAALIEPYWSLVNGSNTTWAPDPSTLKKTYWDPEILTRTLSGLFLAGIDAQLHVDGDLSVRVGLDAAESFRKEHPGHDFRLGLAHDELSHEDDWSRFAELEVDPIMSFQWSQLSSSYIPSTFPSLADYRRQNLQAYAKIENAGRPVTYGSDWPVDPLDEFLALKIAVTRSGDPGNPHSAASQGAPYNGTFPGEGISREAALRAITINGAKFLRADQYIGSLEVGKFADIIVLEHDYFTVPEEMLGRQSVQLTMVGGEVVYVAKEAGQKFGNITAKFPNDDKSSIALDRKAIGGLHRSKITLKGAANAARLRKRKECVHN
jgi:predicted amidohydrolase YtcJ